MVGILGESRVYKRNGTAKAYTHIIRGYKMSLEKIDVSVGSGAEVVSNKEVSVHYTLTLGGFEGSSGAKVVDSSRSRGRPFKYRSAEGQVIQGWDEGVMGMKVGGKRKLIIPSALGYGDRGAGAAIPGGSTLYFDIELLNVA